MFFHHWSPGSVVVMDGEAGKKPVEAAPRSLAGGPNLEMILLP